MSRLVRLVAFGLLLTAVALPNASAAANSRRSLGSRLVKRYLADVRRHDIADLRQFLSPAWQIQRADGSRLTKSEYLGNVPTVRGEAVTGLRVTSVANVVVVTFENSVDEVINGKQFRTAPTARLATFVLAAKGWQMTSFANFNQPQATAAGSG